MIYAAIFAAGVLVGAFGLIGSMLLFIAYQDAKLDGARKELDGVEIDSGQVHDVVPVK